MESGSGFFSLEEFRLDPKFYIDPKLLFVGPRIGEGAHAKVYEGKYGSSLLVPRSMYLSICLASHFRMP